MGFAPLKVKHVIEPRPPLWLKVLNFSAANIGIIMQQKNNRNHLLLYIAVGVFFFIFSALYFYPLLQGKILVQGDIMNFVGVSKETVDHHDATGEGALWTNSMFGGMPTYQVALYNSGNIFEKVNIYMGLFLPRPANYMFIALICFFVLLRSFKVHIGLSIGGALTYALGTYLITFIEAGHNTKVAALALMPLVFAGINYLMRGNLLLGATLSLFAISCQITANHPQITYYMLLMIGCWMASEAYLAVVEKRVAGFMKNIGILFVIVVLGVVANTSKLWTTYEYGKETIRGGTQLEALKKENQEDGLDRDYAFGWSSGIAESFSIMYPNFAGGGSGFSFLQSPEGEQVDSELMRYIQQVYQQDQAKAQELLTYSRQAGKYWGDMPFTSGPIYVGSILCFLFILGALLAKNSVRGWMIAATILSLFLGWGKHFPQFNYFMFDHFPLYNKFRTVSMAMTMLCFTIPVLAFYIAHHFLSEESGISEERKKWGLKVASMIVAGISLVLLLGVNMFDLTNPDEERYMLQANDVQTSTFFDLLKDERAAMIRKDVLVASLFMGLAALALFLYLRKSISARVAIIAICVLPVMDLLIVDSKYLGNENYQEAGFYEQQFRSKLPVIKDKDPYYRVLNTMNDPDKDGTTSFLYKSLGGYHGAKLQRYQDIIDGYINKGNVQVLSMLNTKYVIGARQGKIGFDRNPMACGNAWFVDSIRFVQSNDDEFAGLADFNPLSTAIVHADFTSQIPQTVVDRDSTASIRLKSYGMDKITYTSKSSKDLPAIFSEVWYRGNEDWKAYIDGKYVDHFRANYILRGLWVPAGEHEIVFTFEPKSFYTGKMVSTAASSLILLLVAVGAFLSWKKSNSTNALTDKA